MSYRKRRSRGDHSSDAGSVVSPLVVVMVVVMVWREEGVDGGDEGGGVRVEGGPVRVGLKDSLHGG